MHQYVHPIRTFILYYKHSYFCIPFVYLDEIFLRYNLKIIKILRYNWQ
jgi:hypothetical protein